jgi:hypothetical protein
VAPLEGAPGRAPLETRQTDPHKTKTLYIAARSSIYKIRDSRHPWNVSQLPRIFF